MDTCHDNQTNDHITVIHAIETLKKMNTCFCLCMKDGFLVLYCVVLLNDVWIFVVLLYHVSLLSYEIFIAKHISGSAENRQMLNCDWNYLLVYSLYVALECNIMVVNYSSLGMNDKISMEQKCSMLPKCAYIA